MPRALMAAFWLSGIAGLIYEAVWPHYVTLLVGHGAYAQAAVLAVFLGGMSLGSLGVSKLGSRIRNPLAAYVGVEVLLGVMGLVFHGVYLLLSDLAFETLFPVMPDGFGVAVLKWGLSVGLILPQSILIGAGFPLMSSGVVRLNHGRDEGRLVAVFYFIHSLGAVVGVLWAGFSLLFRYGLPGTTMIAGVLNLVTALMVWSILRGGHVGRSIPVAEPAGKINNGNRLSSWAWLLIVVSFFTAMASFLYEIAWIRMLSLVLGASTHAFEMMLAAFILGLAIGGWLIHAHVDRFQRPERVLAIVQLLMGFFALCTIPLFLHTFEGTLYLMDMFSKSEAGYIGFNVARFLLVGAVMLPATICAGMTLPLITKIVYREGRGESAIGLVYGINTLGSIAGVVLGMLLLMPILGLRGMLIFACGLDMVLGVVLLFGPKRSEGSAIRFRLPGLVAATATAACLIIVYQSFPFEPKQFAEAVFKTRELSESGPLEPVFHQDGRTATVTVVRDSQKRLTMLNNGQADITLSLNDDRSLRLQAGDDQARAQILAAALPRLYAGDPRHVALVGLGSGMTGHYLLQDTRIQSLKVIEIERAVLAAARAFYPANAAVFDDPRADIVIEDAKAFFAYNNQTYDLIVSEPSSPWISGVAGLLTEQFFQRGKRYLSDDGIFVQWLHTRKTNHRIVLTVLNTMAQVFGDFHVYQIGEGDLLIVAGVGPELPDLKQADPEVFSELGFNPNLISFLKVADYQGLAPLLKYHGLTHGDYYPRLERVAEKAWYMNADSWVLRRWDPELPCDIYGRLSGDQPRCDLEPDERGRILRWFPGTRPLSDLFSGEHPLEHLSDSASTFKMRLELRAAPLDWSGWAEDFTFLHRMLHNPFTKGPREPFEKAVREFLAQGEVPEAVSAMVNLRFALDENAYEAAVEHAFFLKNTSAVEQGYIGEKDLQWLGSLALLKAGRADEGLEFFHSFSLEDTFEDELLLSYLEYEAKPVTPMSVFLSPRPN